MAHETGRVMRFVAHSLASVLALAALGLIALLPIGGIALLKMGGFLELVNLLTLVEKAILYGDIALFGISFGSGLLTLMSSYVSGAWKEIKSHWS